MNFTCDLCNYETNKTSNYKRHLESKKHQDKANGVIKYYCHICQKNTAEKKIS